MGKSQWEKVRVSTRGEVRSDIDLSKPLMFGEMLAEEKLTDWVINKDMLDYITRFMTQHLLDYDGHANDGKGVFPAGYTYLGQLITHDIVKSTSNQDSRTVTPWLNLDSIYPSLKSERINDFLDDAGRFKLGSLEPNPTDTLFDFENKDFRRNKAGVAYIVEPRNDENIILSQVTIAWMRFHNRAIDYLIKAEPGNRRSYYYKRARKFGVLVFQEFVVKDYLKMIVQTSVYDHYFSNVKSKGVCRRMFSFFLGESLLNRTRKKLIFTSQIDKDYSTPREFSHGVFRFGHSMVQGAYRLNTVVGERFHELGEIFRKDKFIERRDLANWDLFFFNIDYLDDEHVRGRVNRTSAINLHIAKEFGKPSDKELIIEKEGYEYMEMAFQGEKEDIEIPEIMRNLMNLTAFDLRSSSSSFIAKDIFNGFETHGRYKDLKKMRAIDSIYQISKQVDKLVSGYNFSESAEININGCATKFNANYAPLAFYALAEAEALPMNPSPLEGVDIRKLGPLASIVTSEALLAAIVGGDSNVYEEQSKLEEQLGALYENYQELKRISGETVFSFRCINSFHFINFKGYKTMSKSIRTDIISDWVSTGFEGSLGSGFSDGSGKYADSRSLGQYLPTDPAKYPLFTTKRALDGSTIKLETDANGKSVWDEKILECFLKLRFATEKYDQNELGKGSYLKATNIDKVKHLEFSAKYQLVSWDIHVESIIDGSDAPSSVKAIQVWKLHEFRGMSESDESKRFQTFYRWT